MFEKGKWYAHKDILMYCEGTKDHKYIMLTIQCRQSWIPPRIEIRRFLWEDMRDLGGRIGVIGINWLLKKSDIKDTELFHFHNVFVDIFTTENYIVDEDYYGY